MILVTVLPTKMKADDNVRISLLEALAKPHSVVPNIRQLQHYTGLHKATIKASLDFLAKEGVLAGYGPKLNSDKLGYELEIYSVMQADINEKEIFADFLRASRQDPNVYMLQGIIGSGNFNLVARHIYSDIESYHKGLQEKYYGKIKGIYKLIKDRQQFYLTQPSYKSISRTESVIEILKRDRGF